MCGPHVFVSLLAEYNFKQYASAMLLIVGLILFTLADMSVTPNFNFFG